MHTFDMHSCCTASSMASLRYLQPRNGLPDPKGSLPSQAIAEANWLILEAVHNDKKKQGTYHRYSPAVRSKIAKYALIDVVAMNGESFSILLHVSKCIEKFFLW